MLQEQRNNLMDETFAMRRQLIAAQKMPIERLKEKFPVFFSDDDEVGWWLNYKMQQCLLPYVGLSAGV